jgi:U3 small nucleolar ribonucleoprotein protein IMP4
MLITSSRKPSAKTRILCKQMASFLNCDYINRGKKGIGEVLYLAEGEPLLVVGEYHGNPGSITVFDGEGECLLSIHVNAAFPSGFKYTKLKQIKPVILGTSKLASAIAASLSLEYGEDTSYLRSIRVDDDNIDFFDSGKRIFKLHVKGFRSNDGNGDLS